ncbi:hypothetical protein BDV18DRAFT_158276 [Aspergillus unguis]
MMEELAGRWVIVFYPPPPSTLDSPLTIQDKALSTGIDAMLKLQGISWILRKGVSLATVHFEISTYADPDPDSNATVIDILGIPTGGLPSTREIRVLDWQPKEQQEFLFGRCQHKSRVVSAAKLESGGGGYPEIEMQTKVDEERVKKFLRGEVLEDETKTEWAGGKDGGSWIHTVLRNMDDGVGWTSEQVWGFEVINGERCHTRRVVVATPKGEYVMGRLVYKPAPKD